MSELDASLHAKALAEIGAAKGGRVRAETLSPEERKEIARQGAEARWGNPYPKATHTGQIVIAGKVLSCAVLENSSRVLTQETLVSTITSGARAEGGPGRDGLHLFLSAENLRPFVSDEVRQSTSPVVFRSAAGSKTLGYEAKALPLVCQVYARAREEGKILPEQKPIVQICQLLARGLVLNDITTLVDRATGYEEKRAINELIEILEAHTLSELVPWIKMLPDEFVGQVFRIQGWPCKPGAAKPMPFLGKLLHKYIFEELPPGIVAQMRKLRPVSDKGYPTRSCTARADKLYFDRQISIVLAIMKISDDQDDFEKYCAKAFANQAPKAPLVIKVQPPPHREVAKTSSQKTRCNRVSR